MCDEAVTKPGGAGQDALVMSARQQQVDQLVAWMIWVFDQVGLFLHFWM